MGQIPRSTKRIFSLSLSSPLKLDNKARSLTGKMWPYIRRSVCAFSPSLSHGYINSASVVHVLVVPWNAQISPYTKNDVETPEM